MEEISNEMLDNVDIYYIDINENMKLSVDNQIMSVPTILISKEGEIKNKIVGLQPKTNIIHAIKNIE
jgi:thioredoxin 1